MDIGCQVYRVEIMKKLLVPTILKVIVLSGFIAVYGLAATGNEKLLAKAWSDVGYLDYRQACIIFERLYAETKPESADWREITLGLALCLHQRQPDNKADKERAKQLYDKLIASSDGKSIQATALLLRGKLYQLNDYFGDKVNFKKAAEDYRRILRDWPESDCADEAALYLAQTSMYTMDKEATAKSIVQLKQWMDTHPNSKYIASYWLLIALADRMPLKDQSAAVDASLKAIDAGLPKEMEKDVLYWRIATMAQNIGKTQIAHDFYLRIIKLKRSSYTYSAQQKIIAMGFDAPKLLNPFED